MRAIRAMSAISAARAIGVARAMSAMSAISGVCAMVTRRGRLAAPLAMLAGMLGCTGVAPTVEILGATPETLSASDDARDDLTISLRYSDPDGDLGQGSARVVDCRAEGLVTRLAIPRIANDEAVAQGVPIAGEMDLVVADIEAVTSSDSAPAECAGLGVAAAARQGQVFCVILADAAGNESEGACTGPVLVEP